MYSPPSPQGYKIDLHISPLLKSTQLIFISPFLLQSTQLIFLFPPSFLRVHNSSSYPPSFLKVQNSSLYSPLPFKEYKTHHYIVPFFLLRVQKSSLFAPLSQELIHIRLLIRPSSSIVQN